MPLRLIDEAWLQAHGIDLPDEDLKLLVSQIYGELEMRVGKKLSDDMTSEELDEFDSLSEDDQLEWLKNSYPNYIDVVQRQLDIMEVELQNSDNMQALVESWRRND